MKKIFSFILVVAVLMTTLVMSVNASSLEDELAEKFFDYCGGNDIDWTNPYLSAIDPKVKIYEYTEADGIVFFFAVPCWIEPGEMEYVEVFDKWCVYSPDYNYPSASGLYVKTREDIYSIKDAWEKGLVTDLTPIEGFSKHAKVVRIRDKEPTIENVEPAISKDELAEKFFDYCGGNDIDWTNPYLSTIDPKVKIYEYTEADGIVYFSAVARWFAPGEMEYVEVFDKWCVYSPDYNYPSASGLYVKTREDIYSIKDAWEKGLVTDLTPIEGFSKHAKVVRIRDKEPTTEKTEPTTENVEPTTPTQPTESVVTESESTTPEPTTPTVEPSENKKSKNPIKITAQTKTIKAKKLKNKKQTVKALTITKAQGKFTVTIVKKGTSKKILKKIKINKNGVITLKKGKYNKTTYKIKVKITANGNAKYKSSTKTKTVKIKVK